MASLLFEVKPADPAVMGPHQQSSCWRPSARASPRRGAPRLQTCEPVADAAGRWWVPSWVSVDDRSTSPLPPRPFLAPHRNGLLSARAFSRRSFRKLSASGFTIPFFERLVRDLSLDEKLREFTPLRLALEWHTASPFDPASSVT
jgi:hypothetical protein